MPWRTTAPGVIQASHDEAHATTTTGASAFQPDEGTYRSSDGRTFVVTIQGWWVELATGAVQTLVASTTPDEFT